MSSCNQSFCVGFGRTCITPTESVPLAGYGNTSTRMSSNVLNDLYATCVAFRDAYGHTALMFHLDLICCNGEVMTPARQMISEATGVPFDYIHTSAPHSHSTPDLTNTAEPSIVRYIPWLQKQMVDAAVAAVEDLKPAKMYTTTTQTKGLNFVRHYVLTDGSFKGDNFGDLNQNPYAGHATEADPTMQLVRFVRKGGKDILLVNWRTHPHRTGGFTKPDIAADIVGSMRENMENDMGCLMAYFSGGGGNVNPKSRIEEENITKDYLEQGRAMADTALAAMDSMKEAQLGVIRMVHLVHPGKVNHTQDVILDKAKEIQHIWKTTNDRPRCIKMGEPYGIHSPYHANAIVWKADLGEYLDVDMYAFSIGDLAFVTAPYEMFDTNDKQIRDGSPFPMTFVATLANSVSSYIPSAYGYQYGCYEADCGRFHPGTGEVLAEKYVDMLKAIYEEK